MGFSDKDQMMSNIRGALRSYPLMFGIVALVISLVFKLPILVFLIFVVFLSSLINGQVLKKLSFKLFEALNMKTIALRPDGAKNCSNFINEFLPGKLSTSYGMPSGHSLESMLIAIFLSMYIIKTHEKGMGRNVLIVFILLIGIAVCVSRVVLGCHTIPQIIVGGLIGAVVGYYAFTLWETKIEPLFKKEKQKNSMISDLL